VRAPIGSIGPARLRQAGTRFDVIWITEKTRIGFAGICYIV
jgi:hypothetical protein